MQSTIHRIRHFVSPITNITDEGNVGMRHYLKLYIYM